MKNKINNTLKAAMRIAILVLMFSATTHFAQPGNNSLLWEISSTGLEQPSYLFGTFHLLNDGFLQTKPEVLNHFKTAKQIVVEVEIDSSKMEQLAMMSVMQGNLISNYLSDDEAEQISEVLTAILGVSLAQVDVLKPMALMASLSMIQN